MKVMVTIKTRKLPVDEFLNKIEPYLRNIITDFQNSDRQEIQLTIAITFTCSKDAEEERIIHSGNNNINFTFYNNANEVVDEQLESLNSRYQRNLETSMGGNDFILELVQLLYNKGHKINFKCGQSYILQTG